MAPATGPFFPDPPPERPLATAAITCRLIPFWPGRRLTASVCSLAVRPRLPAPAVCHLIARSPGGCLAPRIRALTVRPRRDGPVTVLPACRPNLACLTPSGRLFAVRPRRPPATVTAACRLLPCSPGRHLVPGGRLFPVRPCIPAREGCRMLPCSPSRHLMPGGRLFAVASCLPARTACRPIRCCSPGSGLVPRARLLTVRLGRHCTVTVLPAARPGGWLILLPARSLRARSVALPVPPGCRRFACGPVPVPCFLRGRFPPRARGRVAAGVPSCLSPLTARGHTGGGSMRRRAPGRRLTTGGGPRGPAAAGRVPGGVLTITAARHRGALGRYGPGPPART
jgi:hypothetical protein